MYKSLVLDAMGCRPGDLVVDLGCGPGANLVAFANAVGPTGWVLGSDHDPEAVAEARRRTFRDVVEAARVLGFQRVTERAVDAGYFTKREAAEWLVHLREGPFLASVTHFVTVAEHT